MDTKGLKTAKFHFYGLVKDEVCVDAWRQGLVLMGNLAV